MSRFHSGVMPKGCNKARIRASARPTLQPKEDTLENSLGEESCGLVVIDFGGGAPMKYDQMKVFSGAVAKHTSIRLQLDIDDGKGWKRMEGAAVGQDEPWRQDYAAGAQFLQDNVYVAASEELLHARHALVYYKYWHVRRPRDVATSGALRRKIISLLASVPGCASAARLLLTLVYLWDPQVWDGKYLC